MNGLKIWTKSLSDDDVHNTLIESSAKLEATEHWCFVEGPTVCDFVSIDLAARAIERVWLVRAFARDFEFFARRIGFEPGKSWMVRVIGASPPQSNDWFEHTIKSENTSRILLFGKADGSGKFVEGTRFRDALEYPRVKTPIGGRAGLLLSECGTDDGAPIVRWMALEQLAISDVME